MVRRIPAILAAALMAPSCVSARAQSVYTDTERARIVTYWNEPGRYSVSAPAEAARLGPWQVRLTPEASLWFLAYSRAVGAAKAPPTVDATAVPAAPDTAGWEEWVQARLARDRWSAQVAADNANASLLPARLPQVETDVPPVPGPIPPSLLAAAGNPPAFAAAVTPMEYTVLFDDGDIYRFQDHVNMRPRYAYYRFARGTVAYGRPLREMDDGDLNALFRAAGFTPLEQKVMGAVSRLEGGFDAVNTYDTGYVSVGFIQFITHADGKHSLIEVLQREKADDTAAYVDDFRRFGLDVTADGLIVAVDPATGAELSGNAAVMKIIDDKRFAGIFQRAGRRSRAFQLAQIRVAKSHYWPADDPVRITLRDRTLEGKASDVVRSESGMATLFDRKVNRGNIEPISEVITRIMTERSLTSFAQLADYEREIIQALKYRADFLLDRSLSQPK